MLYTFSLLSRYSNGVWTGRKQAGCNGSVSMYCGGQVPCQPNWERSCQSTDQTKVEITCTN